MRISNACKVARLTVTRQAPAHTHRLGLITTFAVFTPQISRHCVVVVPPPPAFVVVHVGGCNGDNLGAVVPLRGRLSVVAASDAAAAVGCTQQCAHRRVSNHPTCHAVTAAAAACAEKPIAAALP